MTPMRHTQVLFRVMGASSNKRITVAIDGPAGAGKSTTARRLAERLGYTFLDTGAIYRSLALIAQQRSVSWNDGPSLASLAAGLDIRFRSDNRIHRVLLGEADVTDQIRTPEISDGASRVSSLPEVRAALLDLQRRLGAGGGVVAEGRDVGTVVFPNAEAKFFLVANPTERARRRLLELDGAGQGQPELDEVLREIQARDNRDSSRTAAPLRRAPDAIEIDSTAMGPEAVVDHMVEVVRSMGGCSDLP